MGICERARRAVAILHYTYVYMHYTCMAVNPRESAHKTAVTFGTRAPRKLPDTSENK